MTRPRTVDMFAGGGAAPQRPAPAKRWQDDVAFTQWLLASRYARQEGDKVVPYLTGGVVLYLHEAWTAGRALGPVSK